MSRKSKQLPVITSAKEVYRKNRYNDGSLTFDKWYELSQQNCFYCGDPPVRKNNYFMNGEERIQKYSSYLKNNGDFTYNGVDRSINDDGHTAENCVTCCWKCNFGKRDMSSNEFKAWIIKVYNHFANKK